MATNLWYNEYDYDFSNPGFTQNQQSCQKTAIIWKSTTQLGCGISGRFVVCHYCNSTPNILGQFFENLVP